MKVIGYIRVSTEEQGKSGLGLESQTNKIKSYCELYEMELIGIEVDTLSGKTLKRDGLQTALKALESDKAEGLIVAKLDRLTRNVVDMGRLLESYFNDKNYSLVCVAEQVDTTTAAGRMMLNLMTTISQWERETIGERTKAALDVKKARGEYTGGSAPFGFAIENGKVIENPQEQKILRKIEKLKRQGLSLRKIADELNQSDILNRGKKWNHVTVSKRLKAM